MRRALLFLLVGCGSAAQEARLGAFEAADKGQMDRAADSVAKCAHQEDTSERWHCSALLGDIRVRQGKYAEAAIAFGESFAIRDRIQAKEKYGTPNVGDMYLWGYSLLRIGSLVQAKAVLERAFELVKDEHYDEELDRAAIDLALAEVAKARGTSPHAYELDAALFACSTREVVYFSTHDGDLHKGYFPSAVWLELGDVCKQSRMGDPTPLWKMALDRATRMGETDISREAKRRLP